MWACNLAIIHWSTGPGCWIRCWILGHIEEDQPKSKMMATMMLDSTGPNGLDVGFINRHMNRVHMDSSSTESTATCTSGGHGHTQRGRNGASEDLPPKTYRQPVPRVTRRGRLRTPGGSGLRGAVPSPVLSERLMKRL